MKTYLLLDANSNCNLRTTDVWEMCKPIHYGHSQYKNLIKVILMITLACPKILGNYNIGYIIFNVTKFHNCRSDYIFVIGKQPSQNILKRKICCIPPDEIAQVLCVLHPW